MINNQVQAPIVLRNIKEVFSRFTHDLAEQDAVHSSMAHDQEVPTSQMEHVIQDRNDPEGTVQEALSTGGAKMDQIPTAFLISLRENLLDLIECQSLPFSQANLPQIRSGARLETMGRRNYPGRLHGPSQVAAKDGGQRHTLQSLSQRLSLPNS